MRIISQDGTVDMPYERMIVQIQPNNEKSIIVYDTLQDGEFMRMGVYSTPEKALKAMEMLREYHKEYIYTYTYLSGLGANAIFASNTVHNQRALNTVYDLASLGAFHFPQDDEVKI